MSSSDEATSICWIERRLSWATFERHLDDDETAEVLRLVLMTRPYGSIDGVFELLPREWAATAVRQGSSEKVTLDGLLRWLNTLHASYGGQVLFEYWLRQTAYLLEPRVEAEALRRIADRIRMRARDHQIVVKRQARRARSLGRLLALLSTAGLVLFLLRQWNRDLELTIERTGVGAVACVPVLAAVRACRGPVDMSFQLDDREARHGGVIDDCVSLGQAAQLRAELRCVWQEDGAGWNAVRPASLSGSFAFEGRARKGRARTP